MLYLTEEWDEENLGWKKVEYPKKEAEKKVEDKAVAPVEIANFMQWCGNPIEALLGGGAAAAVTTPVAEAISPSSPSK